MAWYEEVTTVIALVSFLASWTATVAALVYWLSSKFAGLERMVFGYSQSGNIGNGGAVDSDVGS